MCIRTILFRLLCCFSTNDDNANTYWDTAQQMAEAIADFDKIDDQNVRSLQRIDITCASLLAADVLTTVFRHILVASPMQGLPTDETTQATQTVSSSNQWYEIDAVLKRRKRHDGDLSSRQVETIRGNKLGTTERSHGCCSRAVHPRPPETISKTKVRTCTAQCRL
jgi:hypothetical protein